MTNQESGIILTPFEQCLKDTLLEVVIPDYSKEKHSFLGARSEIKNALAERLAQQCIPDTPLDLESVQAILDKPLTTVFNLEDVNTAIERRRCAAESHSDFC